MPKKHRNTLKSRALTLAKRRFAEGGEYYTPPKDWMPMDPSGPVDQGEYAPVPKDWMPMDPISPDYFNSKQGSPSFVNRPGAQSGKSQPLQASPQGQSYAPLSQPWYEHYGETGPEYMFLGDRSPPPVSFTPSTYVPPELPKDSGGSDNSWIMPALGLGASVGKDVYDWYQNSHDPSNSHIGGTGSQADIEAWNDAQLQGIDAPELAVPSWWDRIKGAGQGVLGAAGLYAGVEQGGTEGAATALSGASDVSGALDDYGYGAGSYGQAAGGAGDVLSGISEGGVKGYGQAAVGAGEVADSFGYDEFGNYVPVIGGLLSAYNGLDRGDPGGYAQAVGGIYGAANAAGLVAAPAAAGTMAAGSGAAGALGAFGTAAPLIGAGFLAAELGNKALGTGREVGTWNAFEQAQGDFGLTPVKGKIPSLRLPNGTVVRTSGDNTVGEMLRDAYLGNDSAKVQQIISQIPAGLNIKQTDQWFKDHWQELDPNYRYGKAQGGYISNEGSMKRPMGGLSVLNPQPNLDDSRSYYRYGKPRPRQPIPQPQMMQPSPLQQARGGGIGFGYNGGGSPSELVRGPGSGRSDDIPAQLSDGEYIMDAETVALLGDGSTDEGARRLDELRKRLRMHKGKQLSKGKFSSAAKKPEQYLGE